MTPAFLSQTWMNVPVEWRNPYALVPTRSVRTRTEVTGVCVQRDMCARRESVWKTNLQVSLNSIHSLKMYVLQLTRGVELKCLLELVLCSALEAVLSF